MYLCTKNNDNAYLTRLRDISLGAQTQVNYYKYNDIASIE